MSTRRVFHSVLSAVVAGTLAAAAAGAQSQQGSISGRVTEAAGGQPIASAQVNVIGTNLGTITNSEGQYTIRGVGRGTVEVRALRVGFLEQRQTVTVAAGQTATANFQMKDAPVTLSPVVTTATGEQRRVEVGNAIAQIDAAKLVETRPVSNMADLLVTRAPGVQVFSPVQTGAGTRIRIRGTSSLSLSNNPIYFIDGVRVEGTTGSSSVSVGGTLPARVNDLNPEEIENIEVVKGPSAATLYGTDAANGVIVITTKRGVAGKPQWTTYTEQTALRDLNQYPTAYRGWRSGTTAATTSTASNTVQCFLTQVAAKACAQDSVTAYNLADDPEATPYGTGYRYQYGAQLRGGTDVARYFLHGEWESEDGVTKVPEFEQRYIRAHNLALLPEQKNPNGLTRGTTRANLNLQLPRNFDLAANVGYISEDIRLPMSDDSGVSGIAGNTYGGPGFKYNLNPTTGDTLYGWRQFTPRDVYQATTNQAVERFITSLNSNWRPQEWLALRGNFGVDYTNRKDTQICRFANCPDVGTDRLGYKTDNRTNFFTYTVDAGATATRRLGEAVQSKTTGGVQFYRNIFNRNGATGRQLPPGAQTVTAGAVQTADEATTESRTLGYFLEENVALHDRLFLTGAVRSDRNSAFGTDFGRAFYPKFSASWIVSDESFFPKPTWLSQLRLRGAYGASGVQPGPNDATQFFSSTTARMESGDTPGVVFTTLGNRQLKPERSTEFEGGFDLGFWNSRLTAEITYYNKQSRDALISRVLPPSLGTGATSRFENLGQVSNKGWEALVTAQLVQTNRFGWDVTLNGSRNDNKIVSLGGVPNIVSSSTAQQREGYPLNGWWARGLLGYADKNGNGIIEYNADPNLSEITVSDTAIFLGRPVPRDEVALSSGVDFFRRRVRLSAMVDYKGGQHTYNNTERIRCASRNNCSGLINPKASQFEQARTVMVREHPSRSVGAFIEEGDFIRFREVSLNLTAPDAWASRLLRGRALSATAAIRNPGVLWTKYRGVDPEAFATTGDAPSEFQAFGPPTYFTFRLNLGF